MPPPRPHGLVPRTTGDTGSGELRGGAGGRALLRASVSPRHCHGEERSPQRGVGREKQLKVGTWHPAGGPGGLAAVTNPGRTSRGVWGHPMTHALGTPVSPAHAWGQTHSPWAHPGTPGHSGCPGPHRPTDTSPSVPPWGQSPCCPRGAHGVTCTLLSPPALSQPSRHLSQPHGQRQRWGQCLCWDTQRRWHCCQPQGTWGPQSHPKAAVTPRDVAQPQIRRCPTKRGRPSPCDSDTVVTSAPAYMWHLWTLRGGGTGWDKAAVAPPAPPPPPSSNPTEPPHPSARPHRSPFSQTPAHRPAPSSPLTGTATS